MPHCKLQDGVILPAQAFEREEDILTLNTRNVNRIYLNDGSGVFTSSIQRVGVADSRDAALGDLDGDGDLDAVLANGEDDDRLYINDGTGIFNLRALLPGNGVADLAVALGDMDSDGDLDLVSATAMGIYTSLNDGDGEFTPGAFLPMNRECQAIALGEDDRCGDVDLLDPVA